MSTPKGRAGMSICDLDCVRRFVNSISDDKAIPESDRELCYKAVTVLDEAIRVEEAVEAIAMRLGFERRIRR